MTVTTIAFDKTHIAWDSQITAGDEKLPFVAEKVWIVGGNKIMGFAGDYGLLDEVIDWHTKGARAKQAKENLIGEWELIVLDGKGAWLYSNELPHRARLHPPYAIGSGARWARGAMLARASAFKAVKIATQCDAYSGGEVNVLKIADVIKGWPWP